MIIKDVLLDIKENIIKTKLDNKTKYKVFKTKLVISKSNKFSGNFIVQ